MFLSLFSNVFSNALFALCIIWKNEDKSKSTSPVRHSSKVLQHLMVRFVYKDTNIYVINSKSFLSGKWMGHLSQTWLFVNVNCNTLCAWKFKRLVKT